MSKKYICLLVIILVIVGGFFYYRSFPTSSPYIVDSTKLPSLFLISKKNASLPSDPGEAGKVSLLGVDSDADGVRDDIQIYIMTKYPNSQKLRASLMQLARAEQGLLANTRNKEGAILASKQEGYASECMDYIVGSSTEQNEIEDDLRSQYLNTIERNKAYIKADGLLSGETFYLTAPNKIKTRCEFDPDSMEN